MTCTASLLPSIQRRIELALQEHMCCISCPMNGQLKWTSGWSHHQLELITHDTWTINLYYWYHSRYYSVWINRVVIHFFTSVYCDASLHLMHITASIARASLVRQEDRLELIRYRVDLNTWCETTCTWSRIADSLGQKNSIRAIKHDMRCKFHGSYILVLPSKIKLAAIHAFSLTFSPPSKCLALRIWSGSNGSTTWLDP